MYTKWDNRFMDVANLVSTWSKDPDNKVGAVLISTDNRILSTGYNGLPKNVDHYTSVCKRERTVHAEVNCIIQAQSPLTDKIMYITRFPCAQCAALIAQVGISKIYCPDVEEDSSWFSSMCVAREILAEAHVMVIVRPR